MTNFQKNFHGTVPFSDTDFQLLLAASTALAITVPGTPNQIYRAVFRSSSTAEIWVRLNGTAALPGAGLAISTAYQEFIPLEPKYVKGGDTLSFISASTPQVGVSLLQVSDIT